MYPFPPRQHGSHVVHEHHVASDAICYETNRQQRPFRPHSGGLGGVMWHDGMDEMPSPAEVIPPRIPWATCTKAKHGPCISHITECCSRFRAWAERKVRSQSPTPNVLLGSHHEATPNITLDDTKPGTSSRIPRRLVTLSSDACRSCFAFWSRCFDPALLSAHSWISQTGNSSSEVKPAQKE